ncbi:uncharacterized protein C20orf96 homolog isoform X2 [Pyxicephalus adspersus]|uniref:uncharacterized protein C20orf96 homolog isoform X2 n=1 Tax=Pyxicephalus adspersus TaxID=30357 RepID=UPI003B5959C1
MDYSKWQRNAMNGHSCAACRTPKSSCVQHHRGVIGTNAKSLPSIGLPRIETDSPKRTKSRPPGSITDKNHQKTRNRLSGDFLPYNEPSLSTLRSRCQRLEQDNATLLKAITEVEQESMRSATQYLQQYDKTGSTRLAVQLWADRQIQDAQQDLEKTRVEWQERLTALCDQLKVCENKLQEVQKDLQQLREYRDRGHSVAILQAADLERQLRMLGETHQNRAVDVEALAQTELQKLFTDQQKVKDNALQAVVQQHIDCLPLSLRRMCLQNQEMKQNIQAYQQMVAELQEELLLLQKSGDSLCKSWNEENEKLCRELLLGKPSCSPEEDVVLNIPISRKMPI